MVQFVFVSKPIVAIRMRPDSEREHAGKVILRGIDITFRPRLHGYDAGLAQVNGGAAGELQDFFSTAGDSLPATSPNV